MNKTLGIYIHIPFCLQKCNYCDFCSFPNTDSQRIEQYVNELCRRIQEYTNKTKEYIVDTVYFGGGTPTLLSIAQLEKLLFYIKKSFTVSPTAEITAECNPATVDKKYLTALRTLGVNRLSIGLQSIHENELKALGRLHSFKDFQATFCQARESGFHNISVDLMYGIPHQSTESFKESLAALCRLHPEHISAYGLKIEKGTPFYKMRDSLPLPTENEECQMYLDMTTLLSQYGYEKYEISNFSLPNKMSRHNLRYWQGLEYLGFGVGAHSYFQEERFGNSRNFNAFLQGSNIECEREQLSPNDRLWEYVILSLRLKSGIDLEEFKSKTGLEFFDYFKKTPLYIKEGLMAKNNGRIFFTDRGFLVSNTVLSEMPDFV